VRHAVEQHRSAEPPASKPPPQDIGEAENQGARGNAARKVTTWEHQKSQALVKLHDEVTQLKHRLAEARICQLLANTGM